MVFGGAAVAEFDPSAAAAGDLGDGPFHVRPVSAIPLPKVGIFGPVTSGPAHHRVVRVQLELSPGLGLGAQITQWAAAADSAERHPAFVADRAAVSGRAGHRPGVFVDAPGP